MPLDGGEPAARRPEEYAKAMADPIAARFVRPFRMGRELINGTDAGAYGSGTRSPGN